MSDLWIAIVLVGVALTVAGVVALRRRPTGTGRRARRSERSSVERPRGSAGSGDALPHAVAEMSTLEAVLDGIGDGLVVFDASRAVTRINPAARAMLGLGEGEVVGGRCAEVLPYAELCDLVERPAPRAGGRDGEDEGRILTIPSRGGPKQVQCVVTPIPDRGSKRAGAVLLLRDVTRLIDVERVKSEFLTAASHELRSPLTGLGMSIDLLREGAADKLDARDRELLEAAHEETGRMKALIDDLLELSKIEAGRSRWTFSEARVERLFDTVERAFEGQLAVKEVTLRREVPDDLPAVRADPDKIVWVLTNLVSNALRYVEEGGRIELAARRDGAEVRVSVRDDGPGIPPELQATIFDKFAKDRGARGSGLGLAICKGIVDGHGGTIEVSSAAGRGTVFTFTLPVAR